MIEINYTIERIAKVLIEADDCVYELTRQWIQEFKDFTPEQFADAYMIIYPDLHENRQEIIDRLK